MRLIRTLARRGLGLLLVLVIAGLSGYLGAGTAAAHGEDKQPPQLRTGTVHFYDVQFSKRNVEVGEKFTISGHFYVARKWAEAVADPDTTQLTVVAPGPVILVKDRRIGGDFMPESMRLEKGKDYTFSMELVARRPGTWHVHPMVAVEGAGPLIGPGVDITISESGAATFANFSNSAELQNGKRVDLESYNQGTTVFWHLLYIVPAILFLVYWLSKPLMPRLVALASGEREPDDYITKRDIKVTVSTGIVIMAIVGASFVYATVAWPNQIPLQVKPTASPVGEVEGDTVTVEMLEPGRFVEAQDTVQFKVRLHNTGTERIELREFTTANRLFTTRSDDGEGLLKVDDPATLGPDETREVTLTLVSKAWADEGLVPQTEVSTNVGGILIFTKQDGDKEIAEINTPMVTVHA